MPAAKQLLAKGKVVIAGLLGDKQILQAMQTNEDDTNVAYERAVNHEEADGLRPVVREEPVGRAPASPWIESAVAVV